MMTGIDYRTTSLHYNKGITMDRMNLREKSNYRENTLKKLGDTLPAHMHKPAGRLSLGVSTYSSLEANHAKGSGHLGQNTTFNVRKDFWCDPTKEKAKKT